MRLWLALALALLFVPSLDATVVLPAQFADVVSGSELIAYGRVTSVRAEWVDGRRRIQTLVTVDVLSWFKGGTGATLTFVVPGGEIGRYRNVLVGVLDGGISPTHPDLKANIDVVSSVNCWCRRHPRGRPVS